MNRVILELQGIESVSEHVRCERKDNHSLHIPKWQHEPCRMIIFIMYENANNIKYMGKHLTTEFFFEITSVCFVFYCTESVIDFKITQRANSKKIDTQIRTTPGLKVTPPTLVHENVKIGRNFWHCLKPAKGIIFHIRQHYLGIESWFLIGD